MNRYLLPVILPALLVTATLLVVAEERTVKEAMEMPGWEQWQSERESRMNDPSVVAYYDFQDGTGTTLKNRSQTGSVLDGMIHEGVWGEGRWPGKKALNFNGKSSRIEIPAHDLLCPIDKKIGGTGEMTIEVWMKVTRSGNAAIVGKLLDGNASSGPYALWMPASRLAAYMGRQPGNQVITTADGDVIDKGEWIHVAMTIDDQMLCLYRNGVRVGIEKRKTISTSNNDAPLRIGAIGKGVWTFSGLMDELIIFNKALADADIERHASFRPETAETAGPPSITLLAPHGNDRPAAQSWHRIRWKSNKVNARDSLKIELSTDDGQTWKQLSAAAPNTGEFLWQVKASPSANCRIRVAANESGLVAQSDRAFSIGPAQDVPAYEWVEVTMEAPFAARDGLGALVFKGRMWVIGGWNPNDKKHFPRICNNEVWSSRDGLAWTLEKPNSFLDQSFDAELDWEGRHTAGYVVFKNKMWIVGGDANQGHYMFDVWNSGDGKTWNYVNKGKPVPWGPRAIHHTLVFKDKIWVIGGQTMPAFAGGEERFYRDIWTTTDGITWKQVIPKEPYWPQRGIIGGNVVFKDRIWILGGGTYDTPETPRRKYFNDVWSSADGVNWECHVEKSPWEPRQYHDVGVFDGRMWVLEGYGPGNRPANRNDVWHSSDGQHWYPLPDTPWGARHAAGVFVHDSALWLVAGNNMVPDVWKLVRVI